MRTFGYFLLVCGFGLGGFGAFRYYSSMGVVRGTEVELMAARSGLAEAKGTGGEAEARGKVEALQLRILSEHPVAAREKVASKWWIGGGALVFVIGLVGVFLGKPARRRTKGRFWA